MTAYDFNRTMLALLGSIVFLGLIMEYTSLVFAPQVLKTPGFALPSSAGATAAATPAAAPKEVPLPELLAKADAKKGEADAKICATCHNFDKGGAAKIGPDLWGVVGRPVASAPGFSYSDAVKGARRRLDLREAEPLDRRSEGHGRRDQDGLRRREGCAEARRYPRLPPVAVRFPGPVPEVT